jgi:hypothetical protein
MGTATKLWLSSYPTAVHAVAEMQETAKRPPSCGILGID